MKADFILGVCISNDDPKNMGRIRAIPLSILSKYTSVSDIKNFVAAADEQANIEGKYQPWNTIIVANAKVIDPYVCEPFLPKNISLNPGTGQLVKIIKYDDTRQMSEYIGPFTVDQISLTEEYRNVVNNIQKNINLSEVLPKKTKSFFSGYRNEQIILGEDEILLRLDHVDSNKSRKAQYPFIQLSKFPNSYNLVEKSVDEVEEKDPPVDYICDMFIEYAPKVGYEDKNIIATLIMYSGKGIMNSRNNLGLTKKTVSTAKEYITKESNNYMVKHVIASTTVRDLEISVNKVINKYKSNKGVEFYNKTQTQLIQSIENTKTTVTTYNNIPNIPNAGGGQRDEVDVISDLKNWIFRVHPGTSIDKFVGTFTPPAQPVDSLIYLNYKDYIALDDFITTFSDAKNFGDLKGNPDKTNTVTKKVPELTNEPETAVIHYADKFLFLSSIQSPSLIDDNFFDGLPAKKFAEAMSNANTNLKTYGLLRGEQILELLKKMLNLILDHGHVAGVDPRASLIDQTRDDIKELLTHIENDIKNAESPSKNTLTINHNFRIN